MSITVSYFGTTKPAKGVKPQWEGPPDKLPFNKPNPIDWRTGQHMVQLDPKTAEGGGGGVGAEDIRYDIETHQLQVKVGGEWVMVEGGQAVPGVPAPDAEEPE